LVSPKGRPRTAAALALSALLHLLAAVLLFRGLGGRRSPELGQARQPAPIEISLMETERQERPSPDRPAPGRPSPRPPRHPTRAVAARPREPAPAPAPAAPAVAPEPSTSTPQASEPRSKRPIDLSFDALGDGAKQRAATIPDPGEALEQLLAPPPEARGVRSLDALRAEAERRADAEENVRAGRANPLFFDYLRHARDRLTPDATRLAEKLPLGAAETTKGWARGYLKGVEDAHHGLAAPLRAPDDSVAGPYPDVLGAYNEAGRQAEAGAEQRAAEVCLGVAPNHAAVVTLRRSSGNAALDRLALDSFRSASEVRPVTPDVHPALACYQVRISAHRVPPLPMVSFDLIKRRIIYPLKRITNVTVDLQSIDFGPKKQSSNLLHAR
jgi:outer membrane biosynthesis protein TonB